MVVPRLCYYSILGIIFLFNAPLKGNISYIPVPSEMMTLRIVDIPTIMDNLINYSINSSCKFTGSKLCLICWQS